MPDLGKPAECGIADAAGNGDGAESDRFGETLRGNVDIKLGVLLLLSLPPPLLPLPQVCVRNFHCRLSAWNPPSNPPSRSAKVACSVC